MGRLATHLAVAVANADNLPPTRQLEQVSFWDALLPKSCAKPEKKAALQGKEVRTTNGDDAPASCVRVTGRSDAGGGFEHSTFNLRVLSYLKHNLPIPESRCPRRRHHPWRLENALSKDQDHAGAASRIPS